MAAFIGMFNYSAFIEMLLWSSAIIINYIWEMSNDGKFKQCGLDWTCFKHTLGTGKSSSTLPCL